MTVGPSQALNLGNAPSPYNDSFMTLDLMKGVSTWTYWNGVEGVDIPRSDLTLDAEGWITRMPDLPAGITSIFANVFYGDIAPAGQFILEWDGKGSIEVYQPYTVIGPNKILIDFAADYTDDQGRPQQDGITVIINSIDAANPLRDIKLYRAEDADLIEAGERFDPDWVNAIDDFRILRTHDWQYTNFNTTRDWGPNVVNADQAVWGLDGRGMPYEVIVDIANETRSDLWINIPHTATNDYIRQVARCVLENLDADLRVHAEFSNEHFTTIFDQYQYFQNGGAREFGTAPSAAAQFYGVQSARMDRIFDQVFAEDAGRLRTVVTIDSAAFLSNEARLMLTAPASIAEGGASPVSAGMEVLATDGYLSWWTPDQGDEIRDWMTDADGGFGRAADYLMDQLVNELIPSWRAGRALADEFGMEFMVYEGGTLLLNGADYVNAPQEFTDFAERFSRSEELQPVYEAMAQAWAEIGTGPFAWYNDTGRPGPWGYYGHWDNITFEPLPRGETIVDANGVLPFWDGDDRPAGTFDNGTYDAGTVGRDSLVGSALNDRLFGLAGVDRLQGFAGNDVLWGGDGADSLNGGLGNDSLTGGAGADRLVGSDGRDTASYKFSSQGVVVNLFTELGKGGDAEGDRLSGIEFLIGSSLNDRLTGEQGANSIVGGTGADVISGKGGADFLRGGGGNDSFVFTDPRQGGDRISDFTNGTGNDDRFLLRAKGFDGLSEGALARTAFQTSNSDTATRGAVRIVYDQDDHTLYFDADGSGALRPVLLATLQPGAAVTLSDFLIF
ncbi:MAG: calcium-binding protein [Paracoccaceae bacterium]